MAHLEERVVRGSTMMRWMPPIGAQPLVERYLGGLETAVGGPIHGAWLVGSAATGDFRPGRSDLDLVVAVARPDALGPLDALRLRAHVAARSAHDAAMMARRRPALWPLTVNAVLVRAADLTLAPEAIVPLAGHVAGRVSVGAAFDVNPVTWQVLSEAGVAVLGPQPTDLHLVLDPAARDRWIRANLDGYWRHWARERRVRRPRRPAGAHAIAWGVLGAPRLHATLLTGRVIAKEEAGAYARERFGPRFHPVIDDALAYWCGGEPRLLARRPGRAMTAAAALVERVVEDACVRYRPHAQRNSRG